MSEESKDSSCKYYVWRAWKPESENLCPRCNDILYISSVTQENDQVNFECLNEKCDVAGFVFDGEVYFSNVGKKKHEAKEPTDTIVEIFDTCCKLLPRESIDCHQFSFFRDTILSTIHYLSSKRKNTA